MSSSVCWMTVVHCVCRLSTVVTLWVTVPVVLLTARLASSLYLSYRTFWLVNQQALAAAAAFQPIIFFLQTNNARMSYCAYGSRTTVCVETNCGRQANVRELYSAWRSIISSLGKHLTFLADTGAQYFIDAVKPVLPDSSDDSFDV